MPTYTCSPLSNGEACRGVLYPALDSEHVNRNFVTFFKIRFYVGKVEGLRSGSKRGCGSNCLCCKRCGFWLSTFMVHKRPHHLGAELTDPFTCRPYLEVSIAVFLNRQFFILMVQYHGKSHQYAYKQIRLNTNKVLGNSHYAGTHADASSS